MHKRLSKRRLVRRFERGRWVTWEDWNRALVRRLNRPDCNQYTCELDAVGQRVRRHLPANRSH